MNIMKSILLVILSMTMVSLFGQVKEEIISKKLIIEKKITQEDGTVSIEKFQIEGDAVDDYFMDKDFYDRDHDKMIIKKYHIEEGDEKDSDQHGFDSLHKEFLEDIDEMEEIDIEMDTEKNIMIIRRNGKEEIIELDGYDHKPMKFKEKWTMEEMDDRGYLGVMIDQTADGVKIVEVNKESGAEEAGLKSGDLIREVDGVKVENLEHTIELLRKFKPGESVKLKYDRMGKSSSVLATLGKYKPMMKEKQEFKWIEKHDEDGEKKKIKRKIIIIEEEDE